jgi:hypothetical protein
VASIAAGALVVSWGKKDNSALAQCSPKCPPASVDHIRTLYIVGDVAVGAGIAAIGVGVWRFLAASGSTEGQSDPRARHLFDVQPTLSSVVATVSGTF